MDEGPRQVTGSDLSKAPLRYEDCVEIVSEAVAKDAPASRLLIEANAQLVRDEALRGVAKVVSFPSAILINTTDVCNARCRFCAYFPERVDNVRLGLDKLSTCDWLRFAQSLSLHTGLGEPFTHPEIDRILSFYRENFPYLKVRSNTNGSLLNEKVRRIIVGYVASLAISLNAATRGTYESTMPPLKWGRTISNLKSLREEKVRGDSDLPKITLAYIAHRDNIEELVELPALAREVGANRINVVNLNTHWPKEYRDRLLPQTHSPVHFQELFDRCIQETIKEAEVEGIAITHPPLFGESENEENITKRKGSSEFWNKKDERCFDPWERLFIRRDGDTQVCCGFVTSLPRFTWSTSKRFHGAFWNTPIFTFLRKTINTRDEIPFCRFCRTQDKRDPRLRDTRQELAAKTRAILKPILMQQSANTG